MIRLTADTNLFLRFLLKDIPDQYQKSEQLFTKAREGEIEIIVPQIIIFEIVFTLAKYYGFSKSKVIEGVDLLVSQDYLKVADRDIFKKALVLFGIYNISFVDCFLKSYADSINAEVLSFDKDFKKLTKTKT